MNGTTAYALSKKYVEDTSISLGAVKGAPCTIKSITEVDGGRKLHLNGQELLVQNKLLK